MFKWYFKKITKLITAVIYSDSRNNLSQEMNLLSVDMKYRKGYLQNFYWIAHSVPICIILFLFNLSLLSDSFELKDGKILSGTEVSRTKKNITIKEANGKLKTIPLDKLKFITIEKKIEIKNKETSEEQKDISELRKKIEELNTKIESLSEKQKKEQNNNYKEEVISNKDIKEPSTEKTYTSTGGAKSIHSYSEPPVSDEPNIELTHEIVSDFIWRGNSYGGEYLSRRNNTAYSGTSQYWAYQPNIRLNSPLKGLYIEFWGNFALVGRNDRDSDMRLMQASSGSPAIDPNVYFSKLSAIQTDPSNTNILNSGLFYDPPNNIVNSNCSSDGVGGCSNPNYSFVDPRSVGKHKEKNGMARTDGGFTTFAYNFQNKKYGDITWGVWFYYQMDKNSKYSWDEYFIFWGLPFWEGILKPTVSFYTQSSFESNSLNAGGHYLSFSVSHTFFEGKFFRIQPASNIGYKYPNDNINQKSGFYDVTSNLKFFFADFFFSLNHVYRPNLYMYDNDVMYYTLSQGSQAQPNFSQYDGKTVDPSKLYGVKNEAVYSAIDKIDSPDIVKSYIKSEYQSQKIIQNLFYISFGFNHKF